MVRCLRMLLVASLVVVGAGGVSSATAAGRIKPHVVVLISHDAVPYRDALNGFEQVLAQRGMDVDLEVVALQGDAEKVAPAMLKAKRDGAALVFTMGLVATQAALAENFEVPVVAGLILSVDSLKKSTNATGVVLEMPMKLQFEWIQRLMPSADTTVGVLYNPAENQQRVEEAEGTARAMGLEAGRIPG